MICVIYLGRMFQGSFIGILVIVILVHIVIHMVTKYITFKAMVKFYTSFGQTGFVYTLKY